MTYRRPVPMETATVTQEQVRDLTWTGDIALTQVLGWTTPAYGGTTWEAALTALMSWPSEAAIVDDLVAELTSRLAADPDATFDDPIRVEFEDPEDWDDEDVTDSGPCPVLPRLGNGMHRVAASRIAGARRIRCHLGTRTSDPDDSAYVEVRFHLHDLPETDGSGEQLDADFDALYEHLDWLRSFRLTDQVWVEACGVGSSNGVGDGLWYCPPDLAEDLVAELKRRSLARGVTFEVVSFRPVTEIQLEEEFQAEFGEPSMPATS